MNFFRIVFGLVISILYAVSAFAESAAPLGSIGALSFECRIDEQGNSASIIKNGTANEVAPSKLVRKVQAKKKKVVEKIKALRAAKRGAATKKQRQRLGNKIAAQKTRLVDAKEILVDAKLCKSGEMPLRLVADVVTLEIPLSAIPEGVSYDSIQIVSLGNELDTIGDDDGEPYGGAYSLLPDGLQLLGPATLTVDMSGSTLPINSNLMHATEDSDPEFEFPLQTLPAAAELERKGDHYTQQITHFSKVYRTARDIFNSPTFFILQLEMPTVVQVGEKFSIAGSIARNPLVDTRQYARFRVNDREVVVQTINDDEPYFANLVLHTDAPISPAGNIDIARNEAFTTSLSGTNSFVCKKRGTPEVKLTAVVQFKSTGVAIVPGKETKSVPGDFTTFSSGEKKIECVESGPPPTPTPGFATKTKDFSYTCHTDTIGFYFDIKIPADAINISHDFLNFGGRVCPGAESETITTEVVENPDDPSTKFFRVNVEVTNPIEESGALSVKVSYQRP